MPDGSVGAARQPGTALGSGGPWSWSKCRRRGAGAARPTAGSGLGAARHSARVDPRVDGYLRSGYPASIWFGSNRISANFLDRVEEPFRSTRTILRFTVLSPAASVSVCTTSFCLMRRAGDGDGH
ncbi:hypothetical protein PR202_gb06741 [Eleusine coracana subsp. coracana]|uniref:Uncharacterized protein n=1 Tax=Eleusine coracana subsp. coracana TaxID=191504 RepID=A0AAV5EA64_ELECO|nr:hypothetical protein PR202_gb06741 [Eleusine coracana subsp. coracana]